MMKHPSKYENLAEAYRRLIQDIQLLKVVTQDNLRDVGRCLNKPAGYPEASGSFQMGRSEAYNRALGAIEEVMRRNGLS